MRVILKRFFPSRSSVSLLGFADVDVPSLGIALFGIRLHVMPIGINASLPRRPVREPAGGRQSDAASTQRVISFLRKQDADEFLQAVIDAVMAIYPCTFVRVQLIEPIMKGSFNV